MPDNFPKSNIQFSDWKKNTNYKKFDTVHLANILDSLDFSNWVIEDINPNYEMFYRDARPDILLSNVSRFPWIGKAVSLDGTEYTGEGSPGNTCYHKEIDLGTIHCVKTLSFNNGNTNTKPIVQKIEFFKDEAHTEKGSSELSSPLHLINGSNYEVKIKDFRINERDNDINPSNTTQFKIPDWGSPELEKLYANQFGINKLIGTFDVTDYTSTNTTLSTTHKGYSKDGYISFNTNGAFGTQFVEWNNINIDGYTGGASKKIRVIVRYYRQNMNGNPSNDDYRQDLEVQLNSNPAFLTTRYRPYSEWKRMLFRNNSNWGHTYFDIVLPAGNNTIKISSKDTGDYQNDAAVLVDKILIYDGSSSSLTSRLKKARVTYDVMSESWFEGVVPDSRKPVVMPVTANIAFRCYSPELISIYSKTSDAYGNSPLYSSYINTKLVAKVIISSKFDQLKPETFQLIYSDATAGGLKDNGQSESKAIYNFHGGWKLPAPKPGKGDYPIDAKDWDAPGYRYPRKASDAKSATVFGALPDLTVFGKELEPDTSAMDNEEGTPLMQAWKKANAPGAFMKDLGNQEILVDSPWKSQGRWFNCENIKEMASRPTKDVKNSWLLDNIHIVGNYFAFGEIQKDASILNEDVHKVMFYNPLMGWKRELAVMTANDSEPNDNDPVATKWIKDNFILRHPALHGDTTVTNQFKGVAPALRAVSFGSNLGFTWRPYGLPRRYGEADADTRLTHIPHSAFHINPLCLLYSESNVSDAPLWNHLWPAKLPIRTQYKFAGEAERTRTEIWTLVPTREEYEALTDDDPDKQRYKFLSNLHTFSINNHANAPDQFKNQPSNFSYSPPYYRTLKDNVYEQGESYVTLPSTISKTITIPKGVEEQKIKNTDSENDREVHAEMYMCASFIFDRTVNSNIEVNRGVKVNHIFFSLAFESEVLPYKTPDWFTENKRRSS